MDNSIPVLIAQLVDAYQHIFWDSWVDTSFAVYNAKPLYIVLVSCVAIPLFFLLLKLHQQEVDTKRPSYLSLHMAIGLLIVAGAYVVVIITNIRAFYFRVLAMSSIGSTLFIVSLISLIAAYLGKFRHIFWSLTITALISLALFGVLLQRERALAVAFREQSVVSDMIEQVPANSAEAIILFSPDYILERAIEMPLQVLYDDPNLSVYICYNRTVQETITLCEFESNEIILTREDEVSRFTYDKIIAFSNNGINEVQLIDEIPPDYLDDITIETYNPSALICQDCDYPDIVNRYFTDFPFEYPTHLNTDNRLRHLIQQLLPQALAILVFAIHPIIIMGLSPRQRVDLDA